MNGVVIKTVQNGYMVTEQGGDGFDRMPGLVMHSPYVFESFDALVKWIAANLDKPKPTTPDA